MPALPVARLLKRENHLTWAGLWLSGWLAFALTTASGGLCYFLGQGALFVVVVMGIVAAGLLYRYGPPRRHSGESTSIGWIPALLGIINGILVGAAVRDLKVIERHDEILPYRVAELGLVGDGALIEVSDDNETRFPGYYRRTVRESEREYFVIGIVTREAKEPTRVSGWLRYGADEEAPSEVHYLLRVPRSAEVQKAIGDAHRNLSLQDSRNAPVFTSFVGPGQWADAHEAAVAMPLWSSAAWCFLVVLLRLRDWRSERPLDSSNPSSHA